MRQLKKSFGRAALTALFLLALTGTLVMPALASEEKEDPSEVFASGETAGAHWTQNENGDVVMEDGTVFKAVYPSKEAVEARKKALAEEAAPILRVQSAKAPMLRSASVPPEVPQSISGSATVSWRDNGENSSYFKMSGFTGVPAGVGGDFSSATLHCADPTAAAPYEGMNCSYTATLTSWDASTGTATYSLYVTPPGATDGVSSNEFGLIGYQHLAGTATLVLKRTAAPG